MRYDPANCVEDILYRCSNCSFEMWVPPRRRSEMATTECTNCKVNQGDLWEQVEFDDD